MKDIDHMGFAPCINSKYWNATRKVCPKCGHVIGFYKPKLRYVECVYCGTIVFKDKKSEFDFRIKRRFVK